MPTELHGKSLVIVGGTSGLGLSAARAFLSAGAQLVVVGKEVTEAISPEVVVLTGDACLAETAEQAVQAAVAKFGTLDGLYHVAGGSGRGWGDGPLHEISDDGWDKTLQLNLTSVFYSNRAAIRCFLRLGKGGSILNTGSVLATSPSPHFFATHAYATAKGAIIGLSKAVAANYARQGIRCNVLAPGLVETPMAQRAAGDARIMSFIKSKQPLDGGRIGQPSDLDAAAVYLMSEGSRFVTGQVLTVDGGWSISEGQIL